MVGLEPTTSWVRSRIVGLRQGRAEQSFGGPGRAGRADAERLAEAEPREGVLCDAQPANQIALERLEE